jgi:hypothetical protein
MISVFEKALMGIVAVRNVRFDLSNTLPAS